MKTKIELTENAEMLVDANVQLPNAVKNVLGALIYTRGAFTEHRKENSDWFYKDADSLIEESQVSKKTFFRAINLLEANNFIERKSGSLKKGENKVTQYKILKGVNILSNDTLNDTLKNANDTLENANDTLNDTLEECQKQSNDTLENANDTLNDTLGEPLMTHKNKELSNKNKEKEIDKDKRYNNIINYIEKEKLKEKDLIEIIRLIEVSFNYHLIPNNTENTKDSMDSNIELSKLSQRLDAAAKQFKQMMQTINELQASNNELQLRVSELEAKQNKTSSNQDSSTSSKSTSTVGTSTKQDKSDSKPSNGSSLPTTHQDEEKPTEGKETPSKQIEEDVDVDYEYGLFTSAVEACEANNIPYDGFKLLNFKNMVLTDLSKKNASYRVRKEVEFKINNFIQDFNEKNDLKPSNEQSGIVAHQDDLKPTEGKEMASTSISEDNAASSNDVDDSLDGIFLNEKASKKDECKPSNKGKDCTTVQSEDVKQDDSKEVKDLKMPKTVEGCFQRYLESVEDLTNPTKADLNWRKDCIIESCKKEGFDESFIQELKSKIDEYNKEHSEKSDSKPSNGSTLTPTHQEEEKPTEAQQTPLNEKKLRYLDTATNKQYATEAEAQKDGVNPWFLYDFKVGRCITSYTSHSSHSNTSTLTTIHK